VRACLCVGPCRLVLLCAPSCLCLSAVALGGGHGLQVLTEKTAQDAATREMYHAWKRSPPRSVSPAEVEAVKQKNSYTFLILKKNLSQRSFNLLYRFKYDYSREAKAAVGATCLSLFSSLSLSLSLYISFTNTEDLQLALSVSWHCFCSRTSVRPCVCRWRRKRGGSWVSLWPTRQTGAPSFPPFLRCPLPFCCPRLLWLRVRL